MRALIINAEVKEDIRKLKEIAHAHPISIKEVMGAAIHPKDTFNLKLGDREPGYKPVMVDWIWIQHGYRVAYSVEEQPTGMCAHLSISVDKKGKLPHPVAVNEIAKEFGIDMEKDKITGWVEEFGPGREAVNVVCLLGEERGGSA